jgi:hypothetical protein
MADGACEILLFDVRHYFGMDGIGDGMLEAMERPKSIWQSVGMGNNEYERVVHERTDHLNEYAQRRKMQHLKLSSTVYVDSYAEL